MNQNKLFETTKKATNRFLNFTNSMIEKSKKFRTPSPKVDKIGTTVGSCIGAGLLLSGFIAMFTVRQFWAIGLLIVGVITLVSNFIYRCRLRK